MSCLHGTPDESFSNKKNYFAQHLFPHPNLYLAMRTPTNCLHIPCNLLFSWCLFSRGRKIQQVVKVALIQQVVNVASQLEIHVGYRPNHLEIAHRTATNWYNNHPPLKH